MRCFQNKNEIFEKQQKEIEQTLLQLQQNVKKLYAEKGKYF